MQLVEQHVITSTDPRYAVIDRAAFASKNLYNAALYEVRQAYIFQGRYLSYNEMDKRMKQHEAYTALPRKVSQKVLDQLDKNWKSFFEARKSYEKDPSKFLGRPRLPGYKDKVKGRNLLVYTKQAISRDQRLLTQRLIKPSGLALSVKTRQDPDCIHQVRIVPRKGYYVVEIVYGQAVHQATVDPVLCAGIDLGVNVIAAIASNKEGFVPRIVNGRPLKACNQWYNKRKGQLQHKLGTSGTTRQMERLTNKRNRRIEHFLHTASRRIVDLLVEEEIGTLIIGKNDGWKQECELGSRANQNFVQIPHSRFIAMLTYKAQLVGIQVLVTEESYTSQASFLDLDAIPVYDPEKKDKPIFGGKRVSRGLYRASDGRTIQADVNGAYNILRKGKPDAFDQAKGVAGYVVHPARITVPIQRKASARKR